MGVPLMTKEGGQKQLPTMHLLRMLPPKDAKRAYLVLGHLALIFGLFTTAPEGITFILSLIMFLLGFRFLRRYFTLEKRHIAPDYPGGFFYLSHGLFLFTLLLVKTGIAQGVCCFLFPFALVFLTVFSWKRRELDVRQETRKLHQSEKTVLPQSTTLPELLKDEYFIEKTNLVSLNAQKDYQLVLTNLRLLIFHSKRLDLREIPLGQVLATEVETKRWYFTPRAILFFLLTLILLFILMFLAFLLALVLFFIAYLYFNQLYLNNVLVLHTDKGRLFVSGEGFNNYYTKDILDIAIKDRFSTNLKLPGSLESPGKARARPGFLKAISLPKKLQGTKILDMFVQGGASLPGQPEASFGLANYFDTRYLKKRKRWVRHLFKLAYFLLFLGIFFFYSPLAPYFMFLLFFAALGFHLAWTSFEKASLEEEHLLRLRQYGIDSWDELHHGKETKSTIRVLDKEEAHSQEAKSEREKKLTASLRFLSKGLLGTGWVVIVLFLLLAKLGNDGSIYIGGLFLGILILTLHKVLKMKLDRQTARKRYFQHEYEVMIIFFPWLMEGNGLKALKRPDTSLLTSLREEGFSAINSLIRSLHKPLVRATEKSGLVQAGERKERSFFLRPELPYIYHSGRPYLVVVAGFMVIMIILAIAGSSFGVRDARISNSPLNSSENPGWLLRSSETELDFMKLAYVSFKFYEDKAEDDEGYPARLILVSLKVPVVEISENYMIEQMSSELENQSKDEDIIIEKEVEAAVRKNSEGYRVHYFIYNGTSGQETTYFTKGQTVKTMGAVWRSEKNSLHIAIGFAQVSYITLNDTIPIPPVIPNPLDTTDETNWLELRELVFKVETYEP